MNVMIGEGTYKQLRGCGGLRVRVTSSGRLGLGVSKLVIDKELKLNPTENIEKRRLP